MKTWVKRICESEGIQSVKAFREFFEYYLIGWGRESLLGDDDFRRELKVLAKSRSVAQWKKEYNALADEEIEECLATEKEAESADEWHQTALAEAREKEADKSLTDIMAEGIVECEMRDAGIEYDTELSWQDNLQEWAINPEVKVAAVLSDAHTAARKRFVELVYEYGAIGVKAFDDLPMNSDRKEAVALAWSEFSSEDTDEETDRKFASYFNE